MQNRPVSWGMSPPHSWRHGLESQRPSWANSPGGILLKATACWCWLEIRLLHLILSCKITADASWGIWKDFYTFLMFKFWCHNVISAIPFYQVKSSDTCSHRCGVVDPGFLAALLKRPRNSLSQMNINAPLNAISPHAVGDNQKNTISLPVLHKKGFEGLSDSTVVCNKCFY